MSSLAPLLDVSHLYDPQSGYAMFRYDVINTDSNRNAERLQKDRASQKTGIAGIMNEIHARVSRGEISTSFEHVVPDAPDYFSHEDLVTAYQHESLLQHLDRWPRSEVEQYFNNLKPIEKLELRKKAHETRQYWRQYPDLRVRYFPNARSTFGIFGSRPSDMRKTQSTPRTDLSCCFAKSDSPGRDTKICTSIEVGPIGTHPVFPDAGIYYNLYDSDLPIYAPKPCRQQNIAVNMERLVERFNVVHATMFAVQEASGAPWMQQNSYQQHQYQQQPRPNAPPGLHQQIYTPEYHFDYQTKTEQRRTW